MSCDTQCGAMESAKTKGGAEVPGFLRASNVLPACIDAQRVEGAKCPIAHGLVTVSGIGS